MGTNLTQQGKLAICNYVMLSNFNYCPLEWHFCSKQNETKLEKLQAMALRFVFETHTCPYEELLNMACAPSLRVGRLWKIVLETVYKYSRSNLMTWSIQKTTHLDN
jgi:hypothetical protein